MYVEIRVSGANNFDFCIVVLIFLLRSSIHPNFELGHLVLIDLSNRQVVDSLLVVAAAVSLSAYCSLKMWYRKYFECDIGRVESKLGNFFGFFLRKTDLGTAKVAAICGICLLMPDYRNCSYHTANFLE